LRHTKADNAIATYRRLREQSLWRLLASANGPAVIGLLQTHLFEGDRRLPASILYERLDRDLEDLRAQGVDLPQRRRPTLRTGWPQGTWNGGSRQAHRGGIRTIRGGCGRHPFRRRSGGAPHHGDGKPTGRGDQQLVRLAEETDTNPETRVATLLSERERIDEQIEAIRHGRLQPLPEARALERVH